jgi:predicted kinase
MITVLMGAPGAGKTTWLEANRKPSDHIYNTSAVRINKDLDVATYMGYIRLKAAKAIDQGIDVIADGTHTIRDHRIYWLKLAKRYEINTRLIIFETPLALLLEGNARRTYPASYKAILDHHKRLRASLSIVENEGWTKIERLCR